MAKGFFFRAALLSGSLIVCLLAAEITVRLLFPQYAFDRMFRVADSRSNGGRDYKASALFGYELIPNAKRYVNSLGMRDKEYSFRKPAGAFRIVLLGDSITECGLWSQAVEDRLNERGRYEILNCAVSGWNVGNYAAYLKHKGMSFEPDLVLVGVCLNDMQGHDVNVTYIYDNSYGLEGKYVIINTSVYDTRLFPLMKTYLFRHSYVCRIILSRLIFTRHGEASMADEKYGSMAALKEMKAESGGRILAIIYPYLKPLGEYDKQEIEQYSNVKACLNAAGIEYLDLTPYFIKYGSGIVKFRSGPDDKVHYNDEGNRIKADIIYGWLTSKLKTGGYK